MSGSGLIARAVECRKDTTERADVLAYLERRRANCALVADRCPEFAEDARVQRRQIDVILGEIRAGLHEGEAEIAAERAAPCTETYPFRTHRTLAEVG